MIINGGRAGNVGFWSAHLLRNDTNERAEVKEIRGAVAQDLNDALREMQTVASASRCDENFMYQANINPQAHEQLTPQQWQAAIDTLEKNLGFENHPRVVVEHVKEERQHYHVIWSRVDENLHTVSPWQNYKTHERTARELESELSLEPTPENGRAGNTYALWEEQRAEKTGINPRDVKKEVSELWNQTHTGQEFTTALAERGYILAKGDRRDFCIVDDGGTPHSLARRLDGVKAADVRERMSDVERETLPTVSEARTQQQERHSWQQVEQQQTPTPAPVSTPETQRPLTMREKMEAHFQNFERGLIDHIKREWVVDELTLDKEAGSGGMVAQQGAALEWVIATDQERRQRQQEDEKKQEAEKPATIENSRSENSDSKRERLGSDKAREQSDKTQELAQWIMKRARDRGGRDDDGGRDRD